MSKKVLGKGLDALLSAEPRRIDGEEDEEKSHHDEVVFIPIDRIVPNPDQPRKEFRVETLKELSESIREKGIIQPIIAEKVTDSTYRIVAGERRFRAATLAELSSIPVIIRSFSKEEKLEIALIENVQRDDLSPIEEAEAYQHLMNATGLNQESVAKKVGKKRSTIANSLRLLKMPEEMRQSLSDGTITPGHARAILSLTNPSDQTLLYHRVIEKNLSVREAEKQAGFLNQGRRNSGKKGPKKLSKNTASPEIAAIEQKLMENLGTKVVVKGSNKRGKVEIEYYSMEDLERLYDILSGQQG